MKKLLLLLTVLIFVAGCSGETTAPATETAAPATTTTAAPATTTEAASAVTTTDTASPEGAAALSSCPAGCYMMNCPPPGGPSACCKKVGAQYMVCS